MKIGAIAALGLGALMLAGGTAHAMPAPVGGLGTEGLVQNVMGGDGCGPRAMRTPRGFCRPVGGRYWAPPPRYRNGPPPRRFYRY